MNAKKERALFTLALEQHLGEENSMLEEYRNLSELVATIPAGLLVHWVMSEEELHNAILSAIAKALEVSPAKKTGNGRGRLGTDRNQILLWTGRLRSKERMICTGYRHLNSQVAWDEGDLLELLLDAIIMNSERHERLLLAVEKMVRDE